MNKYIIKSLFCSAIALSALSSCEMDQFPTDSLTDDTSMQTYNDAQSQYKGLLAELRGAVGGANAYISDVQSDLFNQRQTSAVLSKVQNWSFTGTQFDGDVVYSNNYSVIKQANFILGNIGKIEADSSLTDYRRAYLENIKASAYFARAFAYSNLILRYCKDYEPETAATELGMPIVEEINSEYRPARATLQETCDTIDVYLAKAEECFAKVEAYNEAVAASGSQSASQIINSVYEPNADCVTALRARLYLYEHKFDEAIDEAMKIIDNYNLASGQSNLFELYYYDSSNEIIYEPVQTADEVTNSYGIYVDYNFVTSNLTTDLNGFKPDFLPTQGLIDLYESDDLRRKIFFSHNYQGYNSLYLTQTSGVYELAMIGYEVTVVASNGATEDGTLFTKFAGNPLLRKAGDNAWYYQNYNMSKAFRSAEDYLIIAEASLRKATRDESTARDALNALREARGASEVEESVTGDELDKMMQDEWTREFVGEGFRLDCLKRWHQGFTRMTAQSFANPVLISQPNYQNRTVTAEDPRFVWPIPQQDMQSNPNLKQNAGY